MWQNRNQAAMVVILGTRKWLLTFTSRPLHPACNEYGAGDFPLPV